MMAVLRLTWRFFTHPQRAGGEGAWRGAARQALAFVAGFACLLGLAYLVSYLNHGYPPSPADWEVWIQTWGKAWMEPFIPVPLEHYRLFLAGAVIPGVLLLWVGMAGAGRLLSWIFHGKVTFQQYLGLFGFSFFPFWVIAGVIDFVYMGFVSPYIVPALNMEYGPLARELVYAAPMVIYVIPMAAGGVYNAIVTRAAEGFAAWKAAVTGIVTAGLALAVITLLVR
jgi:hypothetical protein